MTIRLSIDRVDGADVGGRLVLPRPGQGGFLLT
jgi:hypothetical protein